MRDAASVGSSRLAEGLGPAPVAWSAVAGFVDECGLNVRGGDGGAGCVAFRREGPVVHGGPNGGDGGKGGDVWLVADRNVASLLAFRDHPHRRAASGAHGKGKDQHGQRGEDLEVAVPEGTVVSDLYTATVLADLVAPRRPLAGRRRRAGRAGQRQVPLATGAGRPASPSRASTARSAGCASSSSSWPTSRSSASPTPARAR